MFLGGPFLRYPFLDVGEGEDIGGSWLHGAGSSSATILASTGWDNMLRKDGVPTLYLATIEPWALADRS